MATCTEQTVARVQRECPFCGQYFQGLGNHLQHCKDRQGRDYSQYLSQKILQKKTRKKKEICPKCQKAFLRLDTHLKNSTFCRTISPPAINFETVVRQTTQGPVPLQAYFTPQTALRMKEKLTQYLNSQNNLQANRLRFHPLLPPLPRLCSQPLVRTGIRLTPTSERTWFLML